MKQLLCCILLTVLISSCSKEESNSDQESEAKQLMRNFVINISQDAKNRKENFLIVPQNGIELILKNGEPDLNYLNAVDGNGQEDLLYGYENDNQVTPYSTTNYLQNFLNTSRNFGKTILVTDYCSDENKVADSYSNNAENGYISFAADHRNLDNIPTFPTQINNENHAIIANLSQVKNFLYLINPEQYSTKSDFINAVTATNYDLVIMDLFFKENISFTKGEISQLRQKDNGGKRLLLCYMSIGEAEDYRFYWNPQWSTNPPEWLDAENPDWKGNYKVKYWNAEWQNIIYGNESSYLTKIIDAGFDGVYLDIIDAFEYYEK